MRTFLIGTGLAVAVASAALAQAAAGWKTYAYPELGFSVELPAAPAVNKQDIQAPAGKVPTTMFTVNEGAPGAIIVGMSDYTGLPITKDVNASLEGAVQGELKNMNATLVSEKTISVGGNPGREVEARNDQQGFLVRSRAIRVGMRLYQLIGAGPVATGVPADFARVESSFKLKAH